MKTINGMEYPEELLEWLKKVNKIRRNNEWEQHRRLWHILEIVDEDRVVVKWWGRRKKRWFYEVIWFYAFRLDYESDSLELVKK